MLLLNDLLKAHGGAMSADVVAFEPGSMDWAAVVADAVAAPSVHNTQPWRFVARPDAVELYLDATRVLPVADPDGRQARLSCGAALFSLRLAVRAGGRTGEVRVLPDRFRPLLLATVRVGRGRPATPLELGLHRAIHRRHSHRRPFRQGPVPPAVRRRMVEAASEEGAELRMVDDPVTVGRLAALIRNAEHREQTDPRFAEELARWTFDGRTRRDGVPRAAGGPRPAPGGLVVLRDFAPDLPRLERDFEPDPLFAVLCSHGDTPVDQVRAGQALQRALLTATVHGAAAGMLSQPVELPTTRAALRKLVPGSGSPQLVLRLGVASTTPTSPRRAVQDVLKIEHGPGAGR
jgi:hypothetical protein